MTAEVTIAGVPGKVAAAIGIPLGFLFCFFGYRFLRATLAISGFWVAGFIAYFITYSATDADLLWSWVAFIIAAVIGLAISGTLLRVGAFMLGALAGGALGHFLNVTVVHKAWDSEPRAIMWICIGVGAFIIAILASIAVRPVGILASAWAGAYFMVAGVGYFAGKYSDTDGRPVDYKPWWWVYFAVTVFLFLLGALVQLFKTARYYNHYRFKEHRMWSHRVHKDLYGEETSFYNLQGSSLPTRAEGLPRQTGPARTGLV